MRIAFDAPPQPGSILRLGSFQCYTLEAVEPYTRKDGTPSFVLHWRSDCPDCGASFRASIGLISNGIARRCPDCRRPQVRVEKARRHVRVPIATFEPASVDPESLF